jgi:hypothetical protein
MCVFCEMMENVPDEVQSKYKLLVENLMKLKYGLMTITVRNNFPTFFKVERTFRLDFDNPRPKGKGKD